MRLFVAINFDEKTKKHLYAAAKHLRDHSVSARISHVENLHLTLAFIGETSRVADAKKAIESIDQTPFKLTLEGYGEFMRDEGNICFAKTRSDKTLTDLAKAVRHSLISQGFDIDKKPFKSHITLARQFIPSYDFSEDSMYDLLCAHKVQVDAVSLMKSERIAGKLTYTEIYKKVL